MPRKRSYYKRKSKKYKKSRKGSRRKGGMNRIVKTKWPKRNYGGDKTFVKLFLSAGQQFSIAQGNAGFAETCAFNVGAYTTSGGAALNDRSVTGRFGTSDDLARLARQFTHYRIKGIKLHLTAYANYTTNTPVVLFTTAASSETGNGPTTTDPVPAFPLLTVSTLPEQRWSKWRIVPNSGAGAKPVTLKVYYSVNKVYGPDNVVKGDSNFCGVLDEATPYFSNFNAPDQAPQRSPWMQYGIFTLDNTLAPAGGIPVTVHKKATVYLEAWGRRNVSSL